MTTADLVRWGQTLSAVGAAWLLTYAFHSTALIGGAWLAQRSGLFGSLRLRDLVWRAALVGALFTATIQMAAGLAPWGLSLDSARSPAAEAPSLGLPPPSREPEVQDPAAIPPVPGTPGPEPVLPPLALPGDERDALPTAPPAPIASSSVDIPEVRASSLLFMAWVAVASVLLLRLAVVRTRVLERLGLRRPVADERLRAALDRLCTDSRAGRPVRLTTAEGLKSPVALGWSEICIPAAVLTELDPAEQRSVLAHELAHLERRDPLWLLLATTLEQLLFFQPLNRVARRNMQEVAEYLCDDWAATRDGSGLPIARGLATVARWLDGEERLVPLAGMAERPSQLVERVERLLSSSVALEPKRSWHAGALALVLLLCIVLVPGVRAAPAIGWFEAEWALAGDTATARATPAPVAAPAAAPAPVASAAAAQDVAAPVHSHPEVKRHVWALVKKQGPTPLVVAQLAPVPPAPEVPAAPPAPPAPPAPVAPVAPRAPAAPPAPPAPPAPVAVAWAAEGTAEVQAEMARARAELERAKAEGKAEAARERALAQAESARAEAEAARAQAEAVRVNVRHGHKPSAAADPATVDALVKALKDSDAGVRQAAAQSLGRLRDPRALEGLAAALGDSDVKVRVAVIEALARLDDPASVPALARALKDAHPGVRRQAAEALAGMDDVPATVEPLVGALGDSDVRVRLEAVAGLAHRGDKRALQPLSALVKDPSPEVRATAVRALGDLRDPSALPALTAALKDDNARVRQLAVRALARIGSAKAVPALIEATRDANADVRALAASALGQLKDPSTSATAVSALKPLLDDPNAEVREQAVEALSRIRDSGALQALIAAMQSKDPAVRKAAAEALGQRE